MVMNSEYPYIRLTKKRGNSHLPCGECQQPIIGGWFASLTESERDEYCPKIAWGFAAVQGGAKPENILTAIRKLSQYAGMDGMIGGQTIDLMYENKTANIETLREICSLKTGALIIAACEIGCILADADDDKVNAAKSYAENLGLAFQIVDDILDVVGSEEKLGKPIHSDIENNKSTFVSLLGIERCRELVGELTDKAKSALDIFGEDANELKELADYLCNRDY
jgi:geranylgeranyl diphosphate synthase type II